MKKVYLITGATSGIGEALTYHLCDAHHTVIGIGRNTKQLGKLEREFVGFFRGIEADITQESSWENIADLIKEEKLDAPDCIILNAGVCDYIDNGQVEITKIRNTFEVNFFANVLAAQYLLPVVAKEREVQLGVVSSIASQLAMPRAEGYGASKAALDYFFNALMLSYPSVSYSLIHPGFVTTPLTAKNDFPMPGEVSADYAAKAIVKGLESKKHYIRFPKWFGLMFACLHRLPLSWQTYFARKMKQQ